MLLCHMCLAARHPFRGVNQWHEVVLLHFARTEVSLLLGFLGSLEGSGWQVLLVGDDMDVNDVNVKDACGARDPESVNKGIVAGFKTRVVVGAQSGDVGGSFAHSESSVATKENFRFVAPTGLSKSKFYHCNPLLLDCLVLAGDKAPLLAGHGMFDQEWLAASIAGILEVKRPFAIAEPKQILKFLQRELHAIDAAGHCGEPGAGIF